MQTSSRSSELISLLVKVTIIKLCFVYSFMYKSTIDKCVPILTGVQNSLQVNNIFFFLQWKWFKIQSKQFTAVLISVILLHTFAYYTLHNFCNGYIKFGLIYVAFTATSNSQGFCYNIILQRMSIQKSILASVWCRPLFSKTNFILRKVPFENSSPLLQSLPM